MTFKEKIAKWKRGKEIERSQKREIKKAEGSAYQKAKIEQAKIFAVQRAKFEREQKYKQLRSRGSGKGIIGSIAKQVNVAAENLGYAPQRAMKTMAGKKKGSKMIKYKGRKYKLVKRKKKKRKAQRQMDYQPRSSSPFSSSLFS